MKFLVFALFVFFSFAKSEAMLLPHFSIDQKDNLEMYAGEKADWKFYFTHEGNLLKHKMFMAMHEKRMHMIVISEDLSHLAHMHPYFDDVTGDFNLKVNQTYRDFDNQDVVKSLPFASRYFIFTEVMPMYSDGRETMMNMDRFVVNVKDSKESDQENSQLKNFSLVLEDEDITDARLGVTQYFTLDGQLGEEGDELKVVFHYEQFQFCDRYLPKFYFNIYKRDGAGEYHPALDFKRWLGMGGHAVLISAENKELKDRAFHHLHAFLPISTPGEFVYPYHDHVNLFLEGVYKIWAQVRIDNQIYKFPFLFKYTLPEQSAFQQAMMGLNFCL